MPTHDRGWTGGPLWIAAAACFAIFALAFGPREAFPVFYIALVEQFGWGRAETSGIYALSLVAGTLAAPAIGSAVDRCGARQAVAWGGFVVAVSMFACAWIQDLWQLYLLFGIVGSLAETAVVLGVFVVLGNSFPKARGTYIGIAYAGISFGPMVLIPGSEWIIRTIDWRSAYMLIGAASLLIVPLAVLLPRASPQPLSATNEANTTGAADELATVPRLVRDVRFRWTAAAYFSAAVIDLALFQHLLPLLVHVGYSAQRAALLLSLASFGYFLGQLAGGMASDTWGRNTIGQLGSAAVLASVAVVLASPASSLMYTVPFVFGAGVGLIINVRTSLCADTFSWPHFGKIAGVLQIAGACGSGGITWFGGFEYDWSSDYTLTYLLAGVSAAIWSLAILRMRALAMQEKDILTAQALGTP